jgi:hypothetical protein
MELLLFGDTEPSLACDSSTLPARYIAGAIGCAVDKKRVELRRLNGNQ